MTIDSEQIQALKAAIDDATQGSWVNESGEGWEAICCDDDQGNAGFIIAEFQGKDATANRKYVQAANPAAIRSLLAERDADKALIAEQAKRIAELREWNEGLAQESLDRQQRIAELKQKHCGSALMEREEHHVGVVNKLLERIAELEARTLNVKLPEPPGPMSLGARAVYIGIVSDVVGAFQEACAAAGITLDVGE